MNLLIWPSFSPWCGRRCGRLRLRLGLLGNGEWVAGGERKSCLVNAEQKLFFTLLYCKAYPTQDVMGLFFGITQGQVNA